MIVEAAVTTATGGAPSGVACVLALVATGLLMWLSRKHRGRL